MTLLPYNVHLLCAPCGDGGREFGIVLAGEMYAFRWELREKPSTIYMAPTGAFGDDQIIRVMLIGRRWQCQQCRSRDGLRSADDCRHAEAARLIQFFGKLE